MMRPRAWLSVLAVMFLTIGLAACGDDDGGSDDSSDTTVSSETTEATDEAGGDADLEALVAEAQEEGSLVWYSVPAEPIAQAVSDAFAEEYGIEV
jgi:ABC-type glycerol-3-phosphate transport system substrate-binding protein